MMNDANVLLSPESGVITTSTEIRVLHVASSTTRVWRSNSDIYHTGMHRIQESGNSEYFSPLASDTSEVIKNRAHRFCCESGVAFR
jgi:hypothetical protein